MPSRLEVPEAESSRKRPRVADGNDEEDRITETREARSSLRGDTRKRVRVSDAESSKDARRKIETTPSTEDEDENNGEPIEYPPDSPPRTQYDELRDGNFEHLQHEAEDDQRATQRLRFRPNRLGDNAVADNGIIESITCVNFMCHTRLHCELGPLLNFIVGENGSGKSAILTAITLCLGGKASSTNRGGSLKSFVKEGCDRAVLSVKIKNQGNDAYKYDIYGDSIVVERHFSKAGSSGFRVKSANGQTISTKRQEIEDIVEYFALQVDNPLNVLSQDNARQFLNASTKAQKYKFFIEGVQLQQLDNDYRLIKENLDQMIAKVPDQEERVKHAEDVLKKAKRKKEAIEGNRQIRIKHRTLRNQLAWSQVIAEEKELAEREKAHAQADDKVAEAERAVQEKTEALRVEDEALERIVGALETAKDEVVKAREHQEAAAEAKEAMLAEMRTIVTEEREAQQTVEAVSANIKRLEENIKAEEDRLEKANGEAHTAKLRELETEKARVQDIEKQIIENKAREPEFKKLFEDAKSELNTRENNLGRARERVTQVDSQIQNLKQKEPSKYSPYEAQIPHLISRIERETRFREKPIGPIGLHVRLLKPEWSNVLESYFGRSLNGFLVTSHEDSRLLQDMIKQIGLRDASVNVVKARTPLNLEGKEPDESFDTILRVLKFDNDLVRDQLIIQHMIEQVILIPERTKAQDIMFNGAPPRNVKAALCFQDGDRSAGLRLTGGNDMMATSPIQSRNQAPRMKGDISSHLAVLADQKRAAEAEYQAVLRQKQEAQAAVQDRKRAMEQWKKDQGVLSNKLRHAELAVNKIEEDLDQYDGADDRLKGLVEQRDELKNELRHHGMQFGVLVQKKKDKNEELKGLQGKFKEARLQLRDAEARLQKIEDKRKRLSDSRHITLTDLNEAHSMVDLLKEEKEHLAGKVARQTERVAEYTRQASAAAPTRVHVPENETYQSLEKQYNALTQRLQAEEKRHGMTEEQINNLVIKSIEERDQAVADLQSIVAVNQGLKQTLGLRLHRWRLFQRFISAQSRCNFQYLLSERGFRGKLLFDHQKKYLDLQVEPDKTEKRATGRSTKTLSGGEKSFSSICLLLSIWEAMGSPLRCLDEFDVFMDNVNRAISTNMLITAARRSVNRQYLFITPNAIEGRNTLDKDVKIIRLTDPRQRTLADH
ncbi:hypothetical protein QBC47DRAFT_386576 [Echria macrotheca]|uniref:RecF/RecN/SMC N-terminal domain-containing protein n=1 Tax=Echria macrotheca TaxID=438768 RepID=A0AAJ0BA21_9PEZI|nr:hypothetical protein QBC47DRAFT_386576 [Echria macrotheca]